jgi:hypothetical protein
MPRCVMHFFLVALFGPVLALTIYFDGFDRFASFVGTHKVWGFEEIIATIFFVGFRMLLLTLARRPA